MKQFFLFLYPRAKFRLVCLEGQRPKFSKEGTRQRELDGVQPHAVRKIHWYWSSKGKDRNRDH